jgi:hypothetical protein
MIFPEMPIFEEIQSGSFKVLSPKAMLLELRIMIQNTNLSSGIFSANHASNYLPLQIRLPGQKEDALSYIDSAIKGEIELKPENMRAI